MKSPPQPVTATATVTDLHPAPPNCPAGPRTSRAVSYHEHPHAVITHQVNSAGRPVPTDRLRIRGWVGLTPLLRLTPLLWQWGKPQKRSGAHRTEGCGGGSAR